MNEIQEDIKKSWYAYDGLGDHYSSSSYRKISMKPIPGRGNKIAAIFAFDGGHMPQPLSNNIQQYIADALFSGESQPHITAPGNKHYVYVKD